jgi:DNA-binding transcriptional MocR family regulator
VIWVALPAVLDTTKLQDAVFKQELAYAPGEIFSAGGGYHNYLRISYCHLWSPRIEKAIIKLGQIFTGNMP